MANIVTGDFTRTNSFGSNEDRTHARFFMHPVQDMIATEQQGRPIFREEERVEIILPGNPHTKPVMKVTDTERQRWPKLYEAFKRGQEIAAEGTPLEMWSVLKPSQVMELKHLGFSTVEQVGAMDDHAVQRIGMGGRKMRELAIAYLDDAERVAVATRLQAEGDRKDIEISNLSRQVEELKAIVNSLHSQVQERLNAPNPIATMIPGVHDPVEQARMMVPAPAAQASSLDNIPAPRRRGRPPKVA